MIAKTEEIKEYVDWVHAEFPKSIYQKFDTLLEKKLASINDRKELCLGKLMGEAQIAEEAENRIFANSLLLRAFNS